jgi:hypothetical protein
MKRPKPPSIVTIAIMTLITVVFWTFFSVFRIFTSTQPVDVPENVLNPIDATLDKEALNDLETKNHLEPHEIPEIIYSTPEPIVTGESVEEETLEESTPDSDETPLPETTPSTIPQDETFEDLQGAI